MRTRLNVFIAVLLVAQSAMAQTGADRVPTDSRGLTLSDCIVSAKDHIQLPAQQAGVILLLETEDGLSVEEGFVVTAGQLIGKLDDEDAAARRDAAVLDHQVSMKERLKAESNVQAAVATEAVAQAELDESLDVNQRVRNSIPATQIRRQELTVTRSAMEKEVAAGDVEVAVFTTQQRQAQITVAEINVKKHQIVSPLDGILVQLYRKPGEWVSPGDPVARIVRMDKLRVEGFVDASRYLPEEIDGREVTVIIRRPNRDPETFKSTISFVSPIVEASGDYRVWAEVDNRTSLGSHWVLRPGMQAEMQIDLP
ncbi:MAG: HlyD family efflux transporter periplasmic adaptor subunit [Planctomycetaceae bacterium]|nr:HlyD family efflux transporter periplasmic adaptor subunit [Planctomycetales bacterium]MCB9875795.1 HlyD family efflux transporter periplasmic adaptor subunit [Planctomycetaceae bacterium]MCB9941378.1 HlyD family efflux transporter periplasmic adaptor subunit [Planctomycetaceae bacterium]HRX80873.1 HlyD family efflux transporter periplasmic adaptor subunit [Pirellulaceae bacterium]